MDADLAAQAFAAMGSEARLRVIGVLVRAGTDGLGMGEIQERTGMAPSTLAHHLRFLAAGGLIRQDRVGRHTISRADYDRLERLSAYILANCCADGAQRAANDG